MKSLGGKLMRSIRKFQFSCPSKMELSVILSCEDTSKDNFISGTHNSHNWIPGDFLAHGRRSMPNSNSL